MRELRPATGINSPQRGVQIPASGPRLGRSSAWGGAPAPWAAPPGAPSRTGPLLPRVTQPEGFRARVRPVAGVVNRLRLSTLDAQPLPLSPWIQFSKSRATGAWASRRLCPPESVSPCSGGGGQTPAPPAGRLSTLGGQRGCPRPQRVQGGAVVQNNLIGQTFLVLHNQPAQSRASIGFQENHCIKK